MKHSFKKTTTFFLIGATAIALSFTACKNGNDAEAEADSIRAARAADSALQAQQAAAAATDGSTGGNATTDMSAEGAVTVGTAKPNPAKARGKGMIVFQADRNKALELEYNRMTIEMDNLGIYNRAEIRPSFPGGQDALAKFIQDNITYPETAIENGVEANVEVMFAVDENGKVYTPMVKGDRSGYGLDEEALKVVSKMPTWNPGQIKGRNVKSYYTLPITFRIN